MTGKIVRMLNGEDVIGEVQEAYPNQETYSPIGYMVTNPYQVQLDATAEMLFEENVSSEPQKINDLNLQLFPWIPLSINNKTLVVLSNVATVYTPHPEVVAKWETLVKAHHNESIENNSPEGSQSLDG